MLLPIRRRAALAGRRATAAMFCEVIRELLQAGALAVPGHKFGPHFLRTEWEQVVDAWQLVS